MIQLFSLTILTLGARGWMFCTSSSLQELDIHMQETRQINLLMTLRAVQTVLKPFNTFSKSSRSLLEESFTSLVNLMLESTCRTLRGESTNSTKTHEWWTKHRSTWKEYLLEMGALTGRWMLSLAGWKCYTCTILLTSIVSKNGEITNAFGRLKKFSSLLMIQSVWLFGKSWDLT